MTKAIKKQEEPAQDLALTNAMLEDAGAGYEEVTAESVALPMILLLQALSPQCAEEGTNARPGMLYETISKQCYKELQVIPVYFKTQYMEWKPRDAGGGLAGRHDCMPADARLNDLGKWVLNNGNNVVETRLHYVLVSDPNNGSLIPALMPMSSTKIKHSKLWMALTKRDPVKKTNADGSVSLINLAMFAKFYRVTAQSVAGVKGNYFNYDIHVSAKPMDTESYAFAKEFYTAIVADKNKYSVEATLNTAASEEVEY